MMRLLKGESIFTICLLRLDTVPESVEWRVAVARMTYKLRHKGHSKLSENDGAISLY